jgi:hypothetical protein
MGVSRRPDLDRYIAQTETGELAWISEGTAYKTRDEHETLTLRRDRGDVTLTMTLDLVSAPASLWTSYTDESEREKWGRLMALVEVRAS